MGQVVGKFEASGSGSSHDEVTDRIVRACTVDNERSVRRGAGGNDIAIEVANQAIA
jgi:hypothetical protein